jgi:dienelactone hydrolase
MIEGYATSTFTHDGVTRTVYRRGSGPGVIVMHEIPGIHPTVIRFANWVVDAGFTVVMPELLGTTGKPVTIGYGLSSMFQACVRREFAVLAAHRSSPITDWLRALCRATHAELGGPGVGAVGMCLTGNFALAMMMEPSLLAPVLSQPSLPFPLGAERRAALHVSPEELDNLRQRAAQGCPVLGLRFTEDFLVPPERFATLRRELGDRFEAIEIDSAVSRPSRNPTGPHSVLTEDLVDKAGHPTIVARDRVLAFFRERLMPA